MVNLTSRLVAPERAVALETTLLLHGVPSQSALPLHHELGQIVRSNNAEPALCGVVAGRPTVGITDDELERMLSASDEVCKVNTANMGVAIYRGQHAATTVGTTMELAAHAGISFFATGGIGGVHKGYGVDFDISADLSALTRFPVAVITSGVKSILDVRSTREALETLGIPVVGVGVDVFPAFYLRDGGCTVDAKFDDMKALAAFCRDELTRTGRGIVVANPIPERYELARSEFEEWVIKAESEADGQGAEGRNRTPAILGALHRISCGATLTANLALVRDNARVASCLAAA